MNITDDVYCNYILEYIKYVDVNFRLISKRWKTLIDYYYKNNIIIKPIIEHIENNKNWLVVCNNLIKGDYDIEYMPKEIYINDKICIYLIKLDALNILYAFMENLINCSQLYDLFEISEDEFFEVRDIYYHKHHYETKKNIVKLSYNAIKLLLKLDGERIYHIPKKYKTYETYTIAVSQNGVLLKDIPIEYHTYELSEIAVKKNGFALAYVLPKYKTKKLCKIAFDYLYYYNNK